MLVNEVLRRINKLNLKDILNTIKYVVHLQTTDAVTRSEEDLDHLRNVLVEAIDEEKTRTQRQRKMIKICMNVR